MSYRKDCQHPRCPEPSVATILCWTGGYICLFRNDDDPVPDWTTDLCAKHFDERWAAHLSGLRHLMPEVEWV